MIERSLPHGHVAAVLGVARACGAEQWFAAAPAALRSVIGKLLDLCGAEVVTCDGIRHLAIAGLDARGVKAGVFKNLH